MLCSVPCGHVGSGTGMMNIRMSCREKFLSHYTSASRWGQEKVMGQHHFWGNHCVGKDMSQDFISSSLSALSRCDLLLWQFPHFVKWKFCCWKSMNVFFTNDQQRAAYTRCPKESCPPGPFCGIVLCFARIIRTPNSSLSLACSPSLYLGYFPLFSLTGVSQVFSFHFYICKISFIYLRGR